MKIAVIGLGVQGNKRTKFAQNDTVYTVDVVNPKADFSSIHSLDKVEIDAGLICVPDSSKIEVARYFLERNCHVLIEKPLIGNSHELENLKKDFISSNLVCYTAYNHRFEPHFVHIANLLKEKAIGKIYKISLHYGNGTSLLVKESPWRDQELGIVSDIGSHLLNLIDYWFGRKTLISFLKVVEVKSWNLETKSPDNFYMIGEYGQFIIEISGSYQNWKNRFFLEIVGSDGSIEMNGLCKWGPSELSIRNRVRPSGIPDISNKIINLEDPTWRLEYEHFKKLCLQKKNEIDNFDLIINQFFENLKL